MPKCFSLNIWQRVPPIPPPSHIPPSSSTVIEDGEFYTSWESQNSRVEQDDDDDISIPPGVILVTQLPDDLSQNEEDSASTEGNENKTSKESSSSIPGAVWSQYGLVNWLLYKLPLDWPDGDLLFGSPVRVTPHPTPLTPVLTDYVLSMARAFCCSFGKIMC